MSRPDPLPAATDLDRHKRRVAAACVALPLFMLGLSFAAVPLYAIFCQVTGYGGTTQRAIERSQVTLDRSMEVLFDGNVRNGLAWRFEPVQRKVDVKLGENALVFYRATNTGDRPLTGTAAFNVDPPAAGIHFQKIACFCFEEQTLQPGESIEMPVTFYVDPKLADDKDARHIGRIVLSYTFFPTEPTKTPTTAAAAPNRQPSASPPMPETGAARQGT